MRVHKMFMLFSPINPYFQAVISMADSLPDLIETILECYQKKIYLFTDSDGLKTFTSSQKAEINL